MNFSASSCTSSTLSSSSSSLSSSYENETKEKIICCFKDYVLSTCYNECTENTCVNARSPPKRCPHVCKPNRCVCKQGLYRNECGECVEKDKCKKVCEPKPALLCTGENEMMVGCFDESKARVCPQKSCAYSNYGFQGHSQPKNLCILNKCECMAGYLRNKCGKCVPERECNKKCSVKCEDPCSGPNEVRVKYYRESEARTCKNYLMPPKYKDRKERVQYNICDCREGHRRDGCGRCVPKAQCYSQVPCKCTNPCADPNEEWQFGNDCLIRTCKNLFELPLKLCINTGYYSCDCSGTKDLWRNEDGECVPRDKCPPPPPPPPETPTEITT